MAGITDVGKVRKNNEDSYIVKPLGDDAWLLCVADGLGGLPAGEVASAITTRVIDKQVKTAPEDDLKAFVLLEGAVENAERALVGEMYDEPTTAGMGTTVVLAMLRGSKALHVYAGDSALMQFRGGRLVFESNRQGVGHVVHSHLGGRHTVLDLEPDTVDDSLFAVEEGDVIVLCSDGLTDGVDTAAIGRIVADGASAQATAEALLTEGLRAGGQDNITVIVARAHAGDDARNKVKSLFM